MPDVFADLVGQDDAVDTLRRAARRGALAALPRRLDGRAPMADAGSAPTSSTPRRPTPTAALATRSARRAAVVRGDPAAGR